VLTRIRTLQDPASQLGAGLQSVSQSVAQVTVQAATMAEKLGRLEPVTRAMADAQVEPARTFSS
jgi:phage shock protein A